MSGQRGFFDLDERYAALSKAGDPLDRFAGVVDFELFRPELDKAANRSDGSKGGRPPMDPVLMFKVLVPQALYGLSDAQAEFQILDRRSFGRFLGIDDADPVPDETTIWRYREALVRAGTVERLLARFDAHLRVSRHGRADRRREHRARAAPANDRRGARGRDARWTLKRGRRKRRPDGTLMEAIATPVFGYKFHIGVAPV
ncbi:transposase [Amaricoccus sp. W119]|uniref:transposase n=1 Tax=Amaricoccus sp. W119 TaxID=3391833 RepID=UPI0039A664A3